MRAFRLGTLITAAIVLACGPGPGERPERAADGSGDPVRENPYLVSLSPVASRYLLTIGAGDRILGVDARSQKLPGLEDRPLATLETAFQLGADLVFTGERPKNETKKDSTGMPAGTRVVEFAPHDLEEVLELSRKVGPVLVGTGRANQFEIALSRPLAKIGGESFGQPRPRTAAVVDLAPVTLAGGHSFETDLIEIAGGSSVTHGGDATRVVVDAEDWARLAPDLIVVMTSRPMNESERNSALTLLPLENEVFFFRFDAESFWLDAPAETAQRFRGLIAARSRALDLNRPPSEKEHN